jgi:hypothetical protein
MKRRLNPKARQDVEEAVTMAYQRFLLHRCIYCGKECLAEELVAHWLEYKGKCNAPNATKEASEPKQPS